MTASLLSTLDFDIFRKLLAGCLPEGAAFAVVDDQGNPVHSEGNVSKEIALQAVQVMNSLIVKRDAGERRFECIPAADDRVILVSGLVLPTKEAMIGALVVVAPEPFPTRGGADLKMLEAIASSLCNDLALNSELDSMASELTERYEELNLVYHTEDQVNYFAEGQDALKQLVSNCCEYLDVGIAVLLMREKGVTLISQNPTQPISDVSFVVARIKEDIYSYVVENVEPLVINDVTAQEAYKAWHGLPYKVLACPVGDKQGGASGVLVIINDYRRSNFSNGDKNLLSVMARKAAKIVQVNYDSLTGLINREGFEYFVDKALQDTRFKETQHSVVHLNVDQLHVINDTISHEAGDAIIKGIADDLRSKIRDSDLIARIGGNDIGILLQNCAVGRGAIVADKLREDVAELMIPWQEQFLNATASLGVAPVEPSADNAAAVLAAAELACKAAKETGKNRVQAYDYGDTKLIQRHQEMEAVGLIQTAIRDDNFVLFGQLIEPLNVPGGWHIEVLLRMLDAEGRPLSPDRFLGAAERYHLMPAIDRWVISHALELAGAHWDRLQGQLTSISINLSGQSLGDPDFMNFVRQQLQQTSLPMDCLCFEITETAAIANLTKAEQFISALKAIGCSFSLDDFGSGLSSFGYLRALPVDYLKIDGSIVKEIATDEVATSMVAAIHQIATVMGLETIAEFVENDVIKDKLTGLGIHYGQGYGIGRPVPVVELFDKLALPAAAAQ